ncbi:MAG: hypothetical protein CL610_10565 [Anaerolineaceae bacterium]|nr:hypothetical protein [Anaerolineaceae bacterium]
MRQMNERMMAQLETRLETITEGLFAHFFGKRLQAHDIALQLVRAVEDGLELADDGDTRPLAPDNYVIQLNTQVLQQLNERYPALAQILADQIVELAASADYRLKNRPQVQFLPARQLSPAQVIVTANHLQSSSAQTAALHPIEPADHHPRPLNPQLIISGHRAIPLDKDIVYIGRAGTNDLVLDDAYVSRAHAQIRLRFGHYAIFDTDSNSGTYVNEVRIREHQLRAGDVIRIGETAIVYMEDDPDQLDETDAINRV